MCNITIYVLTPMHLLLYTQHWRKLLIINCDLAFYLLVFKQLRPRTKAQLLRAHSVLCTVVMEDLNSRPAPCWAPCYKCSFVLFTSASSISPLSHVKLLYSRIPYIHVRQLLVWQQTSGGLQWSLKYVRAIAILKRDKREKIFWQLIKMHQKVSYKVCSLLPRS